MKVVYLISVIATVISVTAVLFKLILPSGPHREYVHFTMTFWVIETLCSPTAAHVSVVADALGQLTFKVMTASLEVKSLVESVQWYIGAGLASAEQVSTMTSSVLLTLIAMFRGSSANQNSVQLVTVAHVSLQRQRKTLLCFCRVTVFLFPNTDFSTSLGRFSRNFTTQRGMFWNILCPIRVFICASLKIWWAKTPYFCRFTDPKSILLATPFHNAREIGISKTIVARWGRSYQTWWMSHYTHLWDRLIPWGMGWSR